MSPGSGQVLIGDFAGRQRHGGVCTVCLPRRPFLPRRSTAFGVADRRVRFEIRRCLRRASGDGTVGDVFFATRSATRTCSTSARPDHRTPPTSVEGTYLDPGVSDDSVPGPTAADCLSGFRNPLRRKRCPSGTRLGRCGSTLSSRHGDGGPRWSRASTDPTWSHALPPDATRIPASARATCRPAWRASFSGGRVHVSAPVRLRARHLFQFRYSDPGRITVHASPWRVTTGSMELLIREPAG